MGTIPADVPELTAGVAFSIFLPDLGVVDFSTVIQVVVGRLMIGAPLSRQSVPPKGYFDLLRHVREGIFDRWLVFLILGWIVAFWRLHCKGYVGADSFFFFTRP